MTTLRPNIDLELATILAESATKMLQEASAYLTDVGLQATDREIRAVNRTIDFAIGLVADAQTLLFSATFNGADEPQDVDNPPVLA